MLETSNPKGDDGGVRGIGDLILISDMIIVVYICGGQASPH